MSKKIKIGDVFGNIEIIDQFENCGRYIQWKCKCKCGKILIIQNRNLKSTTDCGQCNKIRINKSVFNGLIINKELVHESKN